MDNNVEKTNIIMNSYFLQNQTNEEISINGRLYFDYVVLTIHEDKTQYQDNYICWLEENIRKNLASAQNMPMVAQFIDSDKSEPLGHGYPTHKNGKPVIVDSEQVGSAIKAEIKEVDVGGQKVKALVATAYLNEIRYPQLCQWIKARMFDKQPIATSVEIFAKKGNNTIVSETVEVDGKEICVPIDFDFGGSAILTMTPADENAIILEIFNSRVNIENMKEESNNMKTVEELTAELETANNKISELEVKVNTLETEKTELETKVSELETEKTSLEETKTNLEAEKSELEVKLNTLETEKEELVKFKDEAEKAELIEGFETEIKDYDADLIEEVKDEIADFKEEPTTEKSESIINALNKAFYKKMKKNDCKKDEKSEVKLNSLFVSVMETNENKETEEIKVFE